MEMNKSENINELATALSTLQGEIEDVYKDRKGYGYSYADLSSVLNIARPVLAKNGLAVSQLCGQATECVVVETILMHKSGQWISCVTEMRMIVGKDKQGKDLNAAQAAGGIISYARRYALSAILGITQTDNDAAGEEDVVPKNNKPSQPQPQWMSTHFEDSQLRNEKVRDITFKDLSRLITIKGVKSDETDGWLKKSNVGSLKDIKEITAQALIEKLESRQVEVCN
jgi:hypothetical protein